MEIETIRRKLHGFVDIIDDKRAQALYTLFEDEIEQMGDDYSDEFKAELDSRYLYYKNGGKMISAEEADERIKRILQR